MVKFFSAHASLGLEMYRNPQLTDVPQMVRNSEERDVAWKSTELRVEMSPPRVAKK